MINLPECVIIEPTLPCRASVIWLHGLGADGHDFESIVPELRLSASLGIRFIFPHAPHRPVAINGGYVMRAWYDINHPNLSMQEDAVGLRDSDRLITGLIEREIKLGSPAKRIVLAGFSQGGALTLYSGLRYPERLGGLLVLSAYLPLAEKLATERAPNTVAAPIMMMHGTDDTVIPIALAERSREVLTELGHTVSWRRYPMAHSLCQKEISDISAWLTQILT